jgi:hypothetical protein
MVQQGQAEDSLECFMYHILLYVFPSTFGHMVMCAAAYLSLIPISKYDSGHSSNDYSSQRKANAS